MKDRIAIRSRLLAAICTLALAATPGCALGADGGLVQPLTIEYKQKDLNADWSADECTVIDLNAGSTTITRAGDYLLTGTLTGGSITIAASDEDDVRLILNGASITSADGPAIYCKSADKLVITLAEGTANSLADSAVYAGQNDDEPDAALYSDCDLSINGSGALTVTASYDHGILTKDDLKISGGEITVTAPGDALRGRDGTAIRGGVLTLTAGDDGIQANNDESADKGWVVIEGGSIAIASEGKGIAAETTIQLTGGEVSIAADDDGLNSEQSILISGGALSIASGDDAIHAETALEITSGTAVDITGSNEGLEADSILISGGAISVVSSDDGVNASGDDGSSAITITGGLLTVDADGDGMDANGSIAISGGTMLVSGSTRPDNSAIDYDHECVQTGGVLIATGSLGMANSVSASSSQPSILVGYTGEQAAGMRLTLTDAEGNVIASYAPAKAYQCAVICAPGMTVGGTYTLWACGEAADGSGGTLTGGDRLCDITMSATHVQVLSDGSAYSAGRGGRGGHMGGFGGNGGFGGGRTRPGA